MKAKRFSLDQILQEDEADSLTKRISDYFDAIGDPEKQEGIRMLMEKSFKEGGRRADDNTMSNMMMLLHGDSPLDAAVGHNDLQLVKLFIKYGSNTDKPNGRGETPLLRLCHSKNSKHASADVAEYLIDHGASLNATSNYSTTPVAPDETDPEIIATTLHTPLSLAVKRRNKELVKVLLDKGADMTHETVKFALAVACTGGYIGVVKMFLERGFPVNAMCYRKIEFKNIYTKVFRSTLLSASIREKGTSALVKLLLEHGADPNLVPCGTEESNTPLYDAIVASRADIVQLLVDHGTALNQDNYMRLALDAFYRTLRGRALMIKSAEVNSPTSMNGMHLLVQSHSEILEILLCRGVELERYSILPRMLMQCLAFKTNETGSVLKTMAWVRRRNFVKVLHGACLLRLSNQFWAKKRKRGSSGEAQQEYESSTVETVFYNLHRVIVSFL